LSGPQKPGCRPLPPSEWKLAAADEEVMIPFVIGTSSGLLPFPIVAIEDLAPKPAVVTAPPRRAKLFISPLSFLYDVLTMCSQSLQQPICCVYSSNSGFSFSFPLPFPLYLNLFALFYLSDLFAT
jgi:hypothetical protein